MQTVTIKSNGSAHGTHVAIDGVPVLCVRALTVRCGVIGGGGDDLMHVTLELLARVEAELDDATIERIEAEQ